MSSLSQSVKQSLFYQAPDIDNNTENFPANYCTRAPSKFASDF